MNGANIYRATDADIEALATNMRAADRKEMLQWTGQDALWAVRLSVRQSDSCYVGYADDGQLLCAFGAKRDNLIERTAIIWELSTEAVNTHKIAFLRNSRECFDRLCRDLSDVEEFHNWVSAEYTGAVRWIEWLGGALSIDFRKKGLCGGDFRFFYIENPHYKEDN